MSRRGTFADLLLGTTEVAVQVVTLTDAQIKALPTTPITLVSAPGAGFRIKPIAASLYFRNSSGAYTNLNTSYAVLSIGHPHDNWYGVLVNDDSGANLISQLTNALNGVNVVVDLAVPFSMAIPDLVGSPLQEQNYVVTNHRTFPGQTLSDAENAALQLRLDNNGSGNLTGGHASNSLRVMVYHAIEPTA